MSSDDSNLACANFRRGSFANSGKEAIIVTMTSTRAFERYARFLSSRIGLALGGVGVASILLAACGSSNPPSSSITTIPTATTAASSTTAATTTSAPSVNSAVSAAIITDWTKFFSGQTAAATKLALLQNGASFASIVNGQATSGLAQSAKAKVLTVTALTATSAHVHYTIYLGSTPALPNVLGEAIKQDGTWKVSDSSFCVLLNLEGVRSPSCTVKHEGS
jgi:hypothetical protein